MNAHPPAAPRTGTARQDGSGWALTAQTLFEQSLEKRLGELVRKPAVRCTAQTPLADALAEMVAQRVGSILVTDARGQVVGILTRHDVLERVTLARVDLAQPVSTVMTQPVQALTTEHTAQEAALLMARQGIHHVPVTREGALVGIVSERDLFALQRLSLQQVSEALRTARDPSALRAVAPDIRQFARNLIGQGVHARQVTELISHLNDVLTRRLVELVAPARGMDLGRACWLAFGSEGRSEQTISTDQDNGLVFESDDPARDRPAWLAFGQEVNEALDACGYPLCRGGIMAGQPACCLSVAEWRARFGHWIEHGAPEDLLKASIFFDLRPLAGRLDLAEPLRDEITRRAAQVPRFLHQMAINALAQSPPLTWLGGIDSTDLDGVATLDLKLQGTALFVDVARLYALAHGVRATNTRERLQAVAQALHVPASESGAWIDAFEFLQRQRLWRQVRLEDGRWPDRPNVIALEDLHDIDRRLLKETLKVARRLQQRLELDWGSR